MTKNWLKAGYKVTTILDVDKDKCTNYPCKVASTAKEVAEEVDITVTGTGCKPKITPLPINSPYPWQFCPLLDNYLKYF